MKIVERMPRVQPSVTAIPGTAFGSTRRIRLSCACSYAWSDKGLAKFAEFARELP